MSGVNEFSKFIRDLSISLHAPKILYLGCFDAEDLSEFPAQMQVCGASDSREILAGMVEQYPSFEFRQTDPSETPFGDGRFDLVFAHKHFNYLRQDDIDAALREMYRVSSRYVVNFELFSEEGGMLADGRGHYCDMYSRWLDFGVKIISNVQMHPEIDPEQCRFTLVRKITQ